MAEPTKIDTYIFKYKLDPTVSIPQCSECLNNAVQQTINTRKFRTKEYSTYQCEVHK